MTTTWTIAERIRADPDEPATSATRPSSSTSDGAIMLVSRIPGTSLSEATLRSVSPSMLLRCTPVPGTTTPEPQPVEQVSEAAFPSASSTLMWVVQGDCEGQLALAACATWPFSAAASTLRTAPPRYSARSNAGVRCAFAERSAAAIRASEARSERAAQGRAGGEHGERVRDQRAARGRRRVGHERAPAVRERQRAAADRPVGGEVGGGQAAAGGGLVRDQGVRGLAVGELAGAVRGDALERVGERRVAGAVAGAQRRGRRPEDARALGRGAEKARRAASITSACACVISTPSRAERDGGAGELGPRQAAQAAVRRLEARR